MFTCVSPCFFTIKFSDQFVSVASPSHTSCIFRPSPSCYCCGIVTKTTKTTITTTTTTTTTNNNNIRVQQTPAPTIAGQSMGKYMNMVPTFLDAGLHPYIMLQRDISNNEKKFNLIILPLVAIFTS